ncbi:MAG: DUF924 family protein [Hyphomicrobiaceae bacterium]
MLGDKAVPDAWVADVLQFWFVELIQKAWFEKNEAVDQMVRDRFSTVYEAVAQRLAAEALTTPERALATVIVLDQFPRNLFRGSARAYATDPLARDIAAEALACGFDERLDKSGRLFLYLPFEHSENAADQARAVALFARLGDADWLRYAEAHKRIIDRFGRFPHRNAVLGQSSTPEEIAFLQQPGSSF